MSFDDGWEDREREESALLAEARRETLAGLDLNDPEVENFVADAIVRLAPEGAYVPLSVRYPWRFSEPTAGRQRSDLLQPLLRLAALLDEGVLVPGPPPGPCGALSPEVRHDGIAHRMVCELRATHAGQHEATTYGAALGATGKAFWSDAPAFAPANGQEQAEAWERVIAHSALQPAHDVEGPLLDAVLDQLDRYEKLDDLTEAARHEQVAETARAVLEYLQPVLPEQWARDAAGAFGVADLYVADPAENVPPRDPFRTRHESDGIGR